MNSENFWAAFEDELDKIASVKSTVKGVGMTSAALAALLSGGSGSSKSTVKPFSTKGNLEMSEYKIPMTRRYVERARSGDSEKTHRQIQSDFQKQDNEEETRKSPAWMRHAAEKEREKHEEKNTHWERKPNWMYRASDAPFKLPEARPVPKNIGKIRGGVKG